MLSTLEMFDLEDNLPDELVSGGPSWEQMCGNKPPAQGPGPGNNHQQMNGNDDTGLNNAQIQRQMQHQQQLSHHLMVSQGNKIGNVNALMGGGQVSKSPNLQSQQQQSNVQSNNIGGIVHSMGMSIANNGNTLPMNSMQGEFSLLSFFFLCLKFLDIFIFSIQKL